MILYKFQVKKLPYYDCTAALSAVHELVMKNSLIVLYLPYKRIDMVTLQGGLKNHNFEKA
jgi:hypothetical protein